MPIESTGSPKTIFHLEKQQKQCGHFCFPSTTPNCCPCSDLRPHREGNTYPVYHDGHGWCDSGARDDGYCPICNPKNYDDWIKKIEITHQEKELQRKQLQAILESRDILSKEDMVRIIHSEIGNNKGNFVYSNGDEYDGDFLAGQRHGYGTMNYALDGSIYEGHWKYNQQDGFGKKNWGDGIVYEGEWKQDKMHGLGRYTLSCGTIIEGLFENDEFAG